MSTETRRAARALSASIMLAMAAGMLLALPLAPAGAAADPGRHESTARPTPRRIGPGELQRLLDQIVAAGAPGAAAWLQDETGIQQAASGVPDYVATVEQTLYGSRQGRFRTWTPGSWSGPRQSAGVSGSRFVMPSCDRTRAASQLAVQGGLVGLHHRSLHERS